MNISMASVCGLSVGEYLTSLYMELLPLTTPCSARDSLNAFGTCTHRIALDP